MGSAQQVLYDAAEVVCQRNPQLALQPYEQLKAAALMVAEENLALTAAVRVAHALFEKGHAIYAFNWGASALTGEHIRELNETQGKLREALECRK
jgi:hypothetical protein